MIEVGMKYTQSEVVTKEKLANEIGSGELPVYGTPALILLAEKTASLFTSENIEKTNTSVGSHIDIMHLAPTLEGKEVICTATVTQVNGREIVFDIEIFEETKQIGKGTHKRVIVDKERFMSKLS